MQLRSEIYIVSFRLVPVNVFILMVKYMQFAHVNNCRSQS